MAIKLEQQLADAEKAFAEAIAKRDLHLDRPGRDGEGVMLAVVYHARLTKEGRMYDPRHDGDWPLDATHYALVAHVVCAGLGDAFRLTNHCDNAWFANEGVTVLVRARSTSVGDVIVLFNPSEPSARPVAWRVEPVDFSRIAG